jgi:hypothetical protein
MEWNMTLLARLSLSRRFSIPNRDVLHWERLCEILQSLGFLIEDDGKTFARFKRGSTDGNKWSASPQKFLSKLIVTVNDEEVVLRMVVDTTYQDIVGWDEYFLQHEMELIITYVLTGQREVKALATIARYRFKALVAYYLSLGILGRNVRIPGLAKPVGVKTRRISYYSLLRRRAHLLGT